MLRLKVIFCIDANPRHIDDMPELNHFVIVTYQIRKRKHNLSTVLQKILEKSIMLLRYLVLHSFLENVNKNYSLYSFKPILLDLDLYYYNVVECLWTFVKYSTKLRNIMRDIMVFMPWKMFLYGYVALCL